eukprot:CAMPEP_0119144194 /NCGR_PEP_ID=MMETSP1310-20130426/35498_1 /TAXON_ID=464262 /ORGANISM="Genus nov. species nov., Strain RCC2339" /LENGTH=424 /DNA_ID=CAMNT_0007135905 /DNA_START=161 /DNA_END=1431 /DNA_ORIENTATION=-
MYSGTTPAVRFGVLAVCHCLILFALWWAYGDAVEGDFVFDDGFAVLRNADVDPSRSGLTALWRNDFWGTPLSSQESHKSYRPLTILTFRLNFWLNLSSPFLQSGGVGEGERCFYELTNNVPSSVAVCPFGFHMVNLVLHGLNSLLVFHVFLAYSQMQRVGDPSASPRLSPLRALFALAAALHFTVHPVHTEAVTGVVGRADVLSTLFMLLAAISYSFSHTENKRARMVANMLTCATMFAAALCKEIGATMFGVLVAYEILFDKRLFRFARMIVGRRKLGRDTRGMLLESVRESLLRLRGPLCTTLFYLLVRAALNGGEQVLRSFRFVENPIPYLESTSARLLSTMQVHSMYFSLLVWPTRLCHDWSYEAVPVVTSLWDIRNLGPLSWYLSLSLFLYLWVHEALLSPPARPAFPPADASASPVSP